MANQRLDLLPLLLLRVAFVASLLVAAAAAPARAALVCVASDFTCPPAPATCVISGSHDVGADCVLDFGTRNVQITGTWNAAQVGGSFTVQAANLTLNGGKLRSPGDLDDFGGDITVVASGAFVMQGSGPQIFTSGHGGGGLIDVTAASISIEEGAILAEGGSGEENCGDAGDISLVATSGPVLISGATATLRSTAPGYHCSGSEIVIEGTSVTIERGVDCSGGSPFGLDITATAGDITVTTTPGLACDGVGSDDGSGNDAGSIDLTATGDIDIFGPVSGTGSGPDGFGADMTLDAGGTVEITAKIDARGTGGETDGGSIDITGAAGITVGNLLDASASSNESAGGEISLDSNGAVVLSALAELDVNGAAGDAGSIAVTAKGAVTVAGKLNAAAVNGGDGGPIEVSGCDVTISAVIDATGHGAGSALGVELAGGELSILSGTMVTATPCPTGDCLTLRVPSGAPSVSPDAVLAPPPTIVIDPGFAPCCGNGTVDDGSGGTVSAGEDCDDGNPFLCDGCTSTCQTEPACPPDGNACTLDCNPAAGCTYAPQTGTPCDDEPNPCTNDVCQAGVCTHPPLVCNDGIGCTLDTCDPLSGCVFAPDDAACDDDDSCTNDACVPGAGCEYQNEPDGTACNDNSLCTSNDSCQNGDCTGPPLNCDDGSPCTNDACVPSVGCLNAEIAPACDCLDGEGNPEPAGTACAEGNSCTTGDTCDGAGVCQPGTFCADDGDPCTTEGCFLGICVRVDTACPGTGSCIEGLPCSDGNECTTGICESNVCVSEPIACGDGDICTGEELCLENIGCRQVSQPPLDEPQCTQALLDHFACYVARKSPGATDVFVPFGDLPLQDELQSVHVDAKGVKYLCAPANKAGEDPLAPTHEDHLEAYAVKPVLGSPSFAQVTGLEVTNQFGTVTLNAKKLDQLLVPSVKMQGVPPGSPVPPNPDHFACYTVAPTRGKPKFQPIDGLVIEDQFGTLTVDVKKPFRLCNPVSVNGEDPGAPDHDLHLLCYKVAVTRGTAPFLPVSDLFVANPFGLEELSAKRVQTLCLPSTVTPVGP